LLSGALADGIGIRISSARFVSDTVIVRSCRCGCHRRSDWIEA